LRSALGDHLQPSLSRTIRGRIDPAAAGNLVPDKTIWNVPAETLSISSAGSDAEGAARCASKSAPAIVPHRIAQRLAPKPLRASRSSPPRSTSGLATSTNDCRRNPSGRGSPNAHDGEQKSLQTACRRARPAIRRHQSSEIGDAMTRPVVPTPQRDGALGSLTEQWRPPRSVAKAITAGDPCELQRQATVPGIDLHTRGHETNSAAPLPWLSRGIPDPKRLMQLPRMMSSQICVISDNPH
jgi:hypothetical protein